MIASYETSRRSEWCSGGCQEEIPSGTRHIRVLFGNGAEAIRCETCAWRSERNAAARTDARFLYSGLTAYRRIDGVAFLHHLRERELTAREVPS